jgi:hypothetical protein
LVTVPTVWVNCFVAADQNEPRAAVSTTRRRLRWLAIVVAIMALLTAGWPLLNSAVANRQPLAAGSRLYVGTEPASAANVTVGPGWSVLPAQSNPRQGYVLQKGGLQLYLTHVSLVDRNQVPRLWQGLQRILSVSHPGSRLSKPVFITTAHGLRTITGVVVGTRHTGTVTIFPGPSREFAIEIIALAPRRTRPALRAAAARIIASLMFTAPSG